MQVGRRTLLHGNIFRSTCIFIYQNCSGQLGNYTETLHYNIKGLWLPECNSLLTLFGFVLVLLCELICVIPWTHCMDLNCDARLASASLLRFAIDYILLLALAVSLSVLPAIRPAAMKLSSNFSKLSLALIWQGNPGMLEGGVKEASSDCQGIIVKEAYDWYDDS